MTNLISIKDHLKAQGHLEHPYGECVCECDAFNIILTDWGDDPGLFAFQCCECGEVIEIEPSSITCELE